MNALLPVVLSNLAVAGLLAFVAATIGFWGRRPALTHGLWILVLLKLVTPPLFQAPLPWLPTMEEPIGVEPLLEIAALPEHTSVPALPENLFVDPPTEDGAEAENAEAFPETEFAVPIISTFNAAVEIQPINVVLAPEPPTASIDWLATLGCALFAGSLGNLLLVLTRLAKFQRLLRFAESAPEDVRELARRLATELGVTCPQVRLVPGPVSPMLWPVGRVSLLLLPAGLVQRLSADQLATLLAHELAHWRRRDHWVRWLELLVVTLYWWCPLVWWARRELRQAEEECCDAWVIEVLPDCARAYALALVETLDFLSGASSALPPVASGIGHVRLLKRRLTMILRGKTPRALTYTGLLALAGAGALFLPFMPILAQQPPKAQEEAQRGQLNSEKALKVFEVELFAQARPQATPSSPEEQQLRQKLEELTRQAREIEERMARDRRAVEEQAQAIRRALEQRRGGDNGRPKPNDPAQRPLVPQPPVVTQPSMAPPSHPGFPGMPAMATIRLQHGDVEKRLDLVERKLDTLLWQMQELRRELAPRGGVSGGFPGMSGGPGQSGGFAGGFGVTSKMVPGKGPGAGMSGARSEGAGAGGAANPIPATGPRYTPLAPDQPGDRPAGPQPALQRNLNRPGTPGPREPQATPPAAPREAEPETPER